MIQLLERFGLGIFSLAFICLLLMGPWAPLAHGQEADAPTTEDRLEADAPTTEDRLEADGPITEDGAVEDVASAPEVPSIKRSQVILRGGLGLGLLSIPATKGDFLVQDDSPSQSVYSFQGETEAVSKEPVAGISVGYSYLATESVRIGIKLDLDFAFISGGGFLMGGWLGPEVGYRTGDFEVAVAVSPGFNSFNSSLTFESQGYGDVYMEFDGQEIWFDEDGEASGSLSKSSFVVRPEVSVAYRFSEMFGLRGMAAYDIGFGGDSAWKLDARENGDDGASATVEYEGKYVPLSASELPEVIDFSGPTVMLLAEFNWGV